MRGFYALEDTRTPFLLQCVIAASTVVSAVLVAVFVPVGWRTAALAAGWSASYGLGYLLSAQVLARRIGGLQAQATLATYARAGVAAGLAAVAGLVTVMVVGTAVDALGGGVFAERVLSLLAGAPVVLVVYLAVARTLGVGEVSRAVEEVRSRLARLARPARHS
jgi:putative peptidoglycan lipid II flippase